MGELMVMGWVKWQGVDIGNWSRGVFNNKLMGLVRLVRLRSILRVGGQC